MKTLVLNAGYEPLAVVSYRRALILVMTGKANLLAHEAEHPVLGVGGLWERPSVIILARYVRVPMTSGVPLTRRGVMRRDNHRCVYCGKAATTIDHVHPKSRGGTGGRVPHVVRPAIIEKAREELNDSLGYADFEPMAGEAYLPDAEAA